MKSVRKLFAVLVLCISVMASTSVVQAATAYSGLTLFPSYNGIGFSGQTSITISSGKAHAGAKVMASPSASAGLMGVQARLYRSSGALVTSSSTVYNSAGTSSISVSTSKVSGGGNYYGSGIAYVYKGNGYNTYSMPQSPIQGLSVKEISRNQKGEIYGSEYFLNMQGISPDLILAIGTNGKEGYVRAEDLNSEVNTLEEALMYVPADFEIPLYEEDGETIIGSFLVEVPEVIEE